MVLAFRVIQFYTNVSTMLTERKFFKMSVFRNFRFRLLTLVNGYSQP
jgi:hypothetical protein